MERVLGHTSFVVLYFASGVTASAASLVAHPTSVCAGASGAILGIYGALLAPLVVRPASTPKA